MPCSGSVVGLLELRESGQIAIIASVSVVAALIQTYSLGGDSCSALISDIFKV